MTQVSADHIGELARLGSATVYEASGREGLIDIPLRQIIPGSRAAGPARTVACGQNDNLMVHAVLAQVRPGDVLVLNMPEPAPVALVGELLATQAQVHGVAAMLINAAVRDVDELAALGLPIWARYVSMRGADKDAVGSIDEPTTLGGTIICPGDIIVLDADGAVSIPQERLDDVLESSRERTGREQVKRDKLKQGLLSYDLDNLRARVEAPHP